MIDRFHYIQRKLTEELARTVLRSNPHLLAVNYFLRIPELSEDDNRHLPSILLVYGKVGIEVCQRPAQEANSDVKAI